MEESNSRCVSGAGVRCSYSDIAAKLLQDNFLLTALELHTELVEGGREVPQLKEFFSNPANFERPQVELALPPAPILALALGTPIARSPSQATLDSLDLTRLSEDGERSCSDVAVLEFELRKARETINSLRANLTQAADFETTSVDMGCEKPIRDGPLKPHDRRALNFLINEYLLEQDYKLTSITFADEIPEQDFEDWDDVGLNIPRPDSLISLYRGESVAAPNKECQEAETQTDVSCDFIVSEEEKSEIVQAQNEEIILLKKQILALETDKLNYQKLYDAAIASLNSLSSPTSDMPSSETTLYTLQQPFKEVSASSERVQVNRPEENCEQDLQSLPQTASHNYYGSSVSTNSITPDQFEMIECDKNGSSSQRDGSNTSSFEPAVLSEEMMVNSPKSADGGGRLRRDESIATLEDTLSLNEEWPRAPYTESLRSSGREEENAIRKSDAWINCNIQSDYKATLMKACNLPYTRNSHVLREVTGTTQAISPQRLVYVVSETLPKIVPNLLVAKRDEVVGLLVCAIFLQPEQSQRERLLQLLLSLKKKMDRDDRALIISGLVLLLQWNVEVNCGLDSELLGLCWEMLNTKSPEKRMLGAEATIAVAPYVSVELVSSLLLSMVVSMCDSSDPTIRRQGVLGAILVSPTAIARGPQLEALLHSLLVDKESDIVDMCITYLAPVLGRSALLQKRFHSEFSRQLIDKLKSYLKESKKEQLITILKTLSSTLAMAFVYVINVPLLRSNEPESSAAYGEIQDATAREYFDSHLMCHPKFLVDEKVYDITQLVNVFYEVSESNDAMSWGEKDWYINTYVNTLIDSLTSDFPYSEDMDVVMAYLEIFETIRTIFGKLFIRHYVRRRMETEIARIEQKLAKLEGQKCTEAVIVSLYLGAVLGCESGDEEIVGKVIKRWLVCSGMCGIPSSVLGVPIVWYSLHNSHYMDISLHALWDSIVHTSEQVRSFTGSLLTFLIHKASLPESVFTSNIMPAIVTLLSDSIVLVKCSAIDGLGAVVSRSSAPASAVDKAWLSLEGLAKEDPPCRTATKLAATFREILSDGDAITANKVLPTLSALCHNSILNGENVSQIRELLTELLPALQMATHEDITDHFVQSILLPALRNVSRLDHLLTTEHKSGIEALIHKVTSSSSLRDHHRSPGPILTHSSPSSNTLPSILTSPESVGRRVSQMFQHSKPAMNLQNIFKKKT